MCVCTDTKTVTPRMWVLIRCYLITVKLQNRLCYDRVVYRENIDGGGHLMHLMHLSSKFHPSQSSILNPKSSILNPQSSILSFLVFLTRH